MGRLASGFIGKPVGICVFNCTFGVQKMNQCGAFTFMSNQDNKRKHTGVICLTGHIPGTRAWPQGPSKTHKLKFQRSSASGQRRVEVGLYFGVGGGGCGNKLESALKGEVRTRSHVGPGLGSGHLPEPQKRT